jgi:hypothetical protein
MVQLVAAAPALAQDSYIFADRSDRNAKMLDDKKLVDWTERDRAKLGAAIEAPSR